MHETIYGLNLTGIGGGQYALEKTVGGGSGATLYPLGGTYADSFRKDRLPSGPELVANCVGVIYACAILNADLLAGAHLGLFVANPKGAKKPKFVEAGERIGLRTIKNVSPKRQRFIKATSPVAATFDDDVEIQEVVKHPLLDLLGDPDPDEGDGQPALSGYDLRWLTQMYLETVGTAYWFVDRDGNGIPRRIVLLRAQYVREVVSMDPDKIIDYYEYGGSSGYRFDPADIIKFNIPSLRNPYLAGWSPLEAAIEKVRIGRKADASLNALLDNMGRPDAVWSPKGDADGMGIGAREAKRLRSAMREAFGEAGRGGLLVSDMPGVIQPLQWAPQDVVEIERWRQLKTDIGNCFGVPDSKIERNDANLASVKTADYAHKIDAGVPRAKRWDSTLNKRLTRPLDPSGRLFFATDLHIPEDEELELAKQTAAVQAGAITRNEIRDGIDLKPEKWGEAPLVINTMVPVDPQTGLPMPPKPEADDEDEKPEPPKPKKSRRRRSDPALMKLAKAMLETVQTVKSLVESKNGDNKDTGAKAEAADASGDPAIRQSAPADAGNGPQGNQRLPSQPQGGGNGPDLSVRDDEGGKTASNEPAATAPVSPRPAPEPQVSELLATEPAQGKLLPEVWGTVDPAVIDGASSADGIGGESEGIGGGGADKVSPGMEPGSAAPEEALPEVVKAPRRIGRINADGLAGPLPEPTELTEAIKGFFRDQCNRCLKSIEQKAAGQVSTKDDDRRDPVPTAPASPPPPPPIPPVDRLIPWDDDDDELSDLAKPFLRTIAERAANEMNLNLGITSREDIAVVDRNLSAAIEDAAMKFSKSTNQTTRLKLEDAIDKIKEEIENGLVEGDPLPELRKRVQTVFQDASDSRAQMIARTESSRALHTAESISVKESGVVKSKSWLASADACDQCLEYAARGPIPLDEAFDEDDYGPIEQAPGHPNCMCSVTYELKESES